MSTPRPRALGSIPSDSLASFEKGYVIETPEFFESLRLMACRLPSVFGSIILVGYFVEFYRYHFYAFGTSWRATCIPLLKLYCWLAPMQSADILFSNTNWNREWRWLSIFLCGQYSMIVGILLVTSMIIPIIFLTLGILGILFLFFVLGMLIFMMRENFKITKAVPSYARCLGFRYRWVKNNPKNSYLRLIVWLFFTAIVSDIAQGEDIPPDGGHGAAWRALELILPTCGFLERFPAKLFKAIVEHGGALFEDFGAVLLNFDEAKMVKQRLDGTAALLTTSLTAAIKLELTQRLEELQAKYRGTNKARLRRYFEKEMESTKAKLEEIENSESDGGELMLKDKEMESTKANPEQIKESESNAGELVPKEATKDKETESTKAELGADWLEGIEESSYDWDIFATIAVVLICVAGITFSGLLRSSDG